MRRRKEKGPPRFVEFGRRVAQARRELSLIEERDVTGPEIAQACGVHPSSVWRWEVGDGIPDDEVMAKLATFLGTTPAWLRYGIPMAPPDRTTAPKEEDTEEMPTSEPTIDLGLVRRRRGA